MAHNTLFDDGQHRNVWLEEIAASGLAVQSNQHLILDGPSGMLLDPGGHKAYSRVLSHTLSVLGRSRLEVLFLSHQDPDIVAAVNGWLMTTDATAYVSALWTRFVPHFGLDHLLESRLLPIPDGGMKLKLGSTELLIVPAHFLHSPGNFQVYDPRSKILYSGDLGASVGTDVRDVTDFNAHLKFMEGFHRRYMAGNRAMRNWARLARSLDIQIIAPQHGAMFRGKEMVKRFIDWCEALPCGLDIMDEAYRLPT